MISVARRFHRSVSLTHDWGDPRSMVGYVVSPLVRECVERIVTDLDMEEGHRAWSITGPFGTGKSAFSLFLSTLLFESSRKKSAAIEALKEGGTTKEFEKLLRRQRGNWLPVLITGERAPLLPAVLRALKSTAAALGTRRNELSLIVSKIDKVAADVAGGKELSSVEVFALAKDLARTAMA